MPIKKECDWTEMSVDGHYGVNKVEQQEQPIAVNIKVERLDEEESFPHNHLEQVTHFLLISARVQGTRYSLTS